MRRLVLLVVGLCAIAFGSCVRIQTALHDPGFDRADPRGLLRSDPALLYYVTERIVDAGGGFPDDWRADPRIEHPGGFDVPANLTVGEEFLVAWAHLLTGQSFPLHVVCVVVMGVVASAAAIGVLGLAWELSRSVGWSALATLLYVLTPACYRTIGFVLVNEDLSLPLLLAHLWLLARAARVRTGVSFALSGLALGAALATWHATSFFVTLEAAVFFGLYLASNVNPFAVRRSEFVLWPAGLSTFVPALLVKFTIFSPPFAMAAALMGGHRASQRFGGGRGRGMAVAILLFGLVMGAMCSRISGSGFADFSHVWRVLAAKLAHFGRFPSDPSALTFDARLLWQGPFATMTAEHALAFFQLVLLLGGAAAIALLLARRRLSTTRAEIALSLLALASLFATWLVERVSVFTAPVLAVLAALFLERLARMRRARLGRERSEQGSGQPLAAGERSLALLAARAAPAALVLVLAGQAFAFATWRSDVRRDGLVWYRPHARAAGIASALEAVERFVPANDAVAADFMLSPAILAHTRRPTVIQPKWESRASRERVEKFWNAFYHGSPEDLRRLLVEQYECDWLLVDHSMLGELRASRRLAGLADADPLEAGSAAAILLSEDSALHVPPEFRRIWTNASEASARGRGVYSLWHLAGTPR